MALIHAKLAFIVTTLMIGTIGLSVPSFADDADGTVFYTLFDMSNEFNVKSVDYDYDSATNTLTLMNIVDIAHTNDADGIVVNPQDPDLLIVGTVRNGTPQDTTDDNLSTVVIADGTVVPYSSPVQTFHLELTDDSTIFASGVPGDMARFAINGDGSLDPGIPITITVGSDDDEITQLITITGGPNVGKFYYTASGGHGVGSFGEITFAGDTATTTRIHTDLPAAHGGEYDPFSDTVMVVGSSHITQIDATDGSILCDLDGDVIFPTPVNDLDQGTVDGNGHLIVAENGGNLYFVDYPSGDLCDPTTQITRTFLEFSLDDVAPIIMPPDEPFCDCQKPTEFIVAYEGPAVDKINLYKKGKDVGNANKVQLMPVVNVDGNIVVNSNDLKNPKNNLPPNLFYEIITDQGTEVIKIHVSCSQPLYVGQTFTEGNITLTVVGGTDHKGNRSIPDSPDVCPICKEEEHDEGDKKSPIVMNDHEGDNTIGTSDSAGSAQTASASNSSSTTDSSGSASTEDTGLPTCTVDTVNSASTASTASTIDTMNTAKTANTAKSAKTADSSGSN